MTQPISRNLAACSVAGILLFIAVMAVYAPVAGHSFISYDDPLYVASYQPIREGLTARNIVWAFGPATKLSNYWSPMVWLSFMADADVHGLSPGGAHLFNALLHAANAVLLFLALLALTKNFWPSLVVAALFALHPLRVESVAWVTERKDVLMTFFWMLTMLAYAAYARKPGIRPYLAVIVCFLLGLASKPMMVTLPFVLLLLDYWPLQRMPDFSSFLRLVREKLPLFALAAIVGIAAFATQSSEGGLTSLHSISLGVRIKNVLLAYAFYIEKSLWPTGLGILYPYPENPGLAGAGTALALLLGLSTLALFFVKKRPFLAVGWFWYLGTLVPVIGLAVIGPHSVADRYSYVPCIGLVVMMVFLAFDLSSRPLARLALISACILASAVLAVSSSRQVTYWKDSETIYRHTLSATTGNWAVHLNLGSHLLARKMYEKAISEFNRVEAIRPGLAETRMNRARALLGLNRPDEAMKEYGKALREHPKNADIYVNIGLFYYGTGQAEKAFGYFRQAVAADPDSATANREYAVALAMKGLHEAALRYFSKAVRLNPNDGATHLNFGISLFHAGLLNEAREAFKEALYLNPESRDAKTGLDQLNAMLEGKAGK
ncbi:MAG: tetratricopeptide repeat protein [Deltaproteobacteria bacterium]|nr:tetratricopeptide repeat protein [Deltaproteobacteria bacterium]